jgi:hypothetical protein
MSDPTTTTAARSTIALPSDFVFDEVLPAPRTSTTINAQGSFTTINGAPTIPAVNITPFITGSPGSSIPFASQTLANAATSRIPQNLSSFNTAGTITQAILNDPNTVLRNVINQQKITATTVISISTNPGSPLFGGGTDNNAFLQGDPTTTPDVPTANPNAQTLQMTATFWIETVEHTIIVPIFTPGQAPLVINDQAKVAGQPVAKFLVRPPIPIPAPRPITFTTTQIQYSQTVLLNFAGLSWPHVSVSTLVPADAVPIPPSAWS